MNSSSCEATQSGSISVVLSKENDQTKVKSNNFLVGITLSVLSALCFAITSIIVKYTTGVSRSQLAVFRYFGIFLMSLPMVMECGESLFGPSSWWFRLWMLLRGLFGAASLLFKFYALEHISLANTTVIVLSTPIFVFLFARFLLGESFGRYHAISLGLSIFGIGLASKVQNLIFDHHTEHVFENSSSLVNSTDTNFLNISDHNYQTLVGNMYALFSTITGAMTYVFIRKMSTVHHSIILFNFSWIAMLELFPISFVSDEDFVLPTHQYTPYLIFGLACFSFYAQVLMTKAVQMEEAGVVSVIRGSSEAIFSSIFEIFIFGVKPDLYSISGAILVLFSVVLLTFRKYIINLPKDSQLRHRFHFLTI